MENFLTSIQLEFYEFQNKFSNFITDDLFIFFAFNLKPIHFIEMYEIFIWVDRTVYIIQRLKMMLNETPTTWFLAIQVWKDLFFIEIVGKFIK